MEAAESCEQIAHDDRRHLIVVPRGAIVPHFRRSGPARRDTSHVWQLVSDALVAINAGALAGNKKARMDFGGTPRLLGEIHSNRRVTIPAFKRVIGLHSRPFMIGKLKPHIEEFFAGIDGTEELAPDFLRGLDLTGDLDRPLMWDMAVRQDARTPDRLM